VNTTSVSLLKRLRNPEAHADWSRFVTLYTPLVYHWACRLGLQDTDAADLVQEVFTLLFRKLPEFTYQKDGSFRGWLHTVLVNKWRERLRGRPAPSPRGDELPEVACPDPVHDLVEAEFQRHLLMRALQLMQAEFQPTTWKACWEHAILARPVAEVARELNITVNAVYLAKSRVLRRLRQEFEGLLD
jgi:RNA polymerase sigma-70 factor (ECF subfamily)